MGIPFATAMRRSFGTLLVLLVLCFACVSVQAHSCVAHDEAGITAHAERMAADGDTGDAQDPLLSLEDNGYGLDDTFDVPPDYVVVVPGIVPSRPAGIVPAAHAHPAREALRPPIA